MEAVISSKQIFNIKKENTYIIIYSFIATVIAYIFPMEQYQNFLLIIGSVFIPIYTVIFLQYILNREKYVGKLNVVGLIAASIGTVLYYYLNNYGAEMPIRISTLIIPTVIVMGIVGFIY